GCAPLALGSHLQLHGLLDVTWRLDALQLDTGHVHAPAYRCFLDRLAHPLVDLVATHERGIEFHLTDDVAKRGARQRLERIRQVLHGVGGFLRVGDSVVQDRMDVDRHIVLRDHGLTREVEHLFPKVDARGGGSDQTTCAAGFGLEVPDIEGLGPLDERPENVQAGAPHTMKTAEALDNHHFGLTDDAHGSDDDNEGAEGDSAEEDLE